LSRPLPLPDQTGPKLNRAIVALAMPAVGENLLLTAATFADTLLVGWLRSPAALSAVAMAGFINFILTSLFAAVAVACTSIVARSWGADNPLRARAALGQTVLFAFVCAVALLGLGLPLAGPFLRLMGLSGEALVLGSYYLQALFWGNLLALPGIVLYGGMRGTGDTRTPLLITGFMNVVHIGLAYLLVFGGLGLAGMGVYGAALAILVTNAAAGLLALLVTWRGRGEFFLRLRDLRPQRSMISEIFLLAGPALGEQVVFRISQLIYMRCVSGLGEIVLAAHQIALSVESLAYMPGWGFGIASTTLSGQYIGAKKPWMAERSVWRTLVFSVTVLCSIGLLFLLLGRQMATLFGGTPEVVILAGIAIRWSALEQPGLAVFNVLGGALRGAGDTKSPMRATFAGVLVRLAVVYPFAYTFGWGLAGIWLASGLDWIARAIVLLVYYRRGRWKARGV